MKRADWIMDTRPAWNGPWHWFKVCVLRMKGRRTHFRATHLDTGLTLEGVFWGNDELTRSVVVDVIESIHEFAESKGVDLETISDTMAGEGPVKVGGSEP